MTPDEIEALFQSSSQSRTTSQGEDEALSEGEKASRTTKLKEVLLAAQYAWLSGSEAIDLIAEKLGDGSRDASWRVPIGDSGLLNLFLKIVSLDGLRQPLKIHALRLVGNSCADTDENRARVVESNCLGSIINRLADDSLLPFVIPVLYNICVDYEPAQLQASNAGLSAVLVDIIRTQRLLHCRPFLNIICKTLQLLVTQEPEAKLANPETPALFLTLATSRTYPLDLEEFVDLTSVALAYLANEQFQAHLLETGYFELIIEAFADSYSRFDIASADPDNAQELKQVWNGFVQISADISALPSFPIRHPVGSPVVQRLTNWLSGPPSDTHLQTAACLCLGNLARSDEASIAIVKDVFPPLLSTLTKAVPSLSTMSTPDSPPPSQLIHAVISFLKNLAIPPANRALLGSLLDLPLSILPHLWSATDTQPQTQFAAVSLTRLLLTGTPANVRRICAPLSADPASPAGDHSNLHLLMALRARVDAEPTKLEAARAVAAVCRALHSTPVAQVLPAGWDASPVGTGGGRNNGEAPCSNPLPLLPNPSATPEEADGVARRARFYQAHGDVYMSLTQLVTQGRFPTLRSEAWFVLALMSRSADGAHMATETLGPIEACRAFIETVTGRDMLDGHELLAADPTGGGGLQQLHDHLQPRGEEKAAAAGGMDPVEGLGLEPQQVDPAQAASMAMADRENCLVVVAEVLRHCGDYLPLFKKNILEEILSKGGEQVLHERKQREENNAGSGSS